MKTPTLIPIDLSKCFKGEGAGYGDHPDIKATKNYLARIGGEYFAGRFSRQWYGWNFDGWSHNPGVGLQLDKPGTNASSWQDLWEIQNQNTPRKGKR